MRTATILLAITFFCAPLAVAADDAVPAGQAIFEAQKCTLCHSVPSVGLTATTTSEKMKGPDIVNVTDTHEDLAWLGQFIKQEVEYEGAKHKKGFKGTDEELQTLVAWIAEQRVEAEK